MKRLIPVLVLVLAFLPAVVWAQSRTPLESLALLDAALEQPAIDVHIGMLLPASDLPSRKQIQEASAAAIQALDVIGTSPCYGDWYDVVHMAYLLLGRAMDLLDAADEYEASLNNDGRDQARAEVGPAASGGWYLFLYAALLRERVTCGPAPTLAPPAPTVPPQRTPTPERSLTP